MGCCTSKDEKWDMNFKETELSSNRCDAIWEDKRGLEATFGMGPHSAPCARFSAAPGVIRCQVGFCGGTTPNPSYDDVGDHTLAINVEYDPLRITYEQLVRIFFTYHDIFLRSETPENRSTIFCRTEDEKVMAEAYMSAEQAKHEHTVVTVIRPFKKFVNSDDDRQHAILLSNRDVWEKIRKRLRPFQLGYSHLACRLEGYLAGYATPEEFDKELPELFIPPRVAVLVRKKCAQNQIPEPGADNMNDWG